MSLFIICRREYYEMLSDRCAAELLYFFSQQRPGWFTITIEQLKETFFGTWGRDAIRKALNRLDELGLVVRRHHRLNGRAWQYLFVADQPTTVADQPTTTIYKDPFSLDPGQEKERNRTAVQVDLPPITRPVEEAQAANFSNKTIPLTDKSSAPTPPVKKLEVAREKEIWEIALGQPYPVFLNWWAQTHYEPQGGKWASNARGNAYSEFYNNRQKTTAVIFPQFLDYLRQVTEVCNQQVAAGIKALLPSCFVMSVEATHENVQKIMESVRSLVEQGVEVALPQGIPTSACAQSISFAAAANTDIKQLPVLEPVLEKGQQRGHDDLLSDLTRNQAKWQNAPILRHQVVSWVERTPGVVLGSDGPELEQDLESAIATGGAP